MSGSSLPLADGGGAADGRGCGRKVAAVKVAEGRTLDALAEGAGAGSTDTEDGTRSGAECSRGSIAVEVRARGGEEGTALGGESCGRSASASEARTPSAANPITRWALRSRLAGLCGADETSAGSGTETVVVHVSRVSPERSMLVGVATGGRDELMPWIRATESRDSGPPNGASALASSAAF
jgi:hypothetical protein